MSEHAPGGSDMGMVPSFRCPNCDASVFRDDLGCMSCGADLVFDPDRSGFVLGSPCEYRNRHRCNWVAGATTPWCRACDHIERSLDPSSDVAFCSAVRRTLHQLWRSGFDVDSWSPQLVFRLLAPQPGEPVLIGHADGVITLDVTEADPAVMETRRVELGEPYRTPLGHVRHEIGHWLQLALVDLCGRQSEVAGVFGDATVDYQQALRDHYASYDDGSWQSTHISFYATAHPWEDFAESVAHVLHFRDVLDTRDNGGSDDSVGIDFEPAYLRWSRLTVELNQLSRAMGVQDFYPFAPAPAAVAKLAFVNGLLFDRVAG